MTAKRLAAWSLIISVLVGALAARMLVGSTGLGVPGGEFAAFMIGERTQRMVVAAIVGLALAVSGVALQALLRNPLAEPFILGLSTGAGLGIIVQSYLAVHVGYLIGPPGLGAAVGTLLTLGVVYAASIRRGVIDRLGLLLVGVVLSTINGAGILLVNHLAGPGGVREQLIDWMMGYLPNRGGLGWQDGLAAVICLGFMGVLFWQGRAIDIGTLNDDEAQALGVRIGRLKTLLLISASVLTATAVLIAGPIAFIGLIAPHLARLLLGPAHRPLIVAAALLGASLLVLADTASAYYVYRGLPGGRVPVGIFTAMLGGPAFLWLLRPQLGRGME